MAIQFNNLFGATESDSVIQGTFRNDSLEGTENNDTITGRGGDDTILGGDGDDDLQGGLGDDVLVGQKGNDVMDGGIGNDILVWNNGDGSDVMLGGLGYDIALVNGSSSDGDEFTLRQEGSNAIFDRINLVPFNLNVSGVEKFEVNGLGGDDKFSVSDLSATGVQLVQFSGGDGNDILDGSLATTTLQAFGGTGDDLLQGGALADTLYGDENNDTLLGGGENDALFGGDGDDIIDGQKGNDLMDGGAGNDILIWNNGDGSDIHEGGEGYDTAIVNGSNDSGDEFVLEKSGERALFQRVNFGQFSLDTDAVELFQVNGLGGDDIFTVKDLSGTDVQVVAFGGGEGNDLFNGTEATTSLYVSGDGGDDTIIGGSANDTLIGGGGNNVMTGGDGADYFGFIGETPFNASTIGNSQITDFVGGTDKIALDKTVFDVLTSEVGNGFSVASEFAVVGSDAEAATSGAAIVFSAGTGNLFYNQNGAVDGLGEGSQFANLAGVSDLTANDFVIQA